MRNTRIHIMLKAAPFVLSAVLAMQAFAGGLHKEIKRSTEKEVRIKLESSFGTVVCSKGVSNKVMIFDLKMDDDRKPNVDIDYRIKNDIGYLDISHESDGENSVPFHFNDDNEDKNDGNFVNGKWYMRFTDAVPLSIDAELGAGRGDFDMTGLDIKGFTMSAGASSTTLLFGEPNKS